MDFKQDYLVIQGDFGASLQLGQDLFNHSVAFAPVSCMV